MGKRNKVTTRDIAEYTGVSQSTVSMILSNKPHVSFSKETIDKVRQGAKELGYKKPVAGVKKKEHMAPGEMEKIVIPKAFLDKVENGEITVSVEKVGA